jgi:hypothetical protein
MRAESRLAMFGLAASQSKKALVGQSASHLDSIRHLLDPVNDQTARAIADIDAANPHAFESYVQSAVAAKANNTLAVAAPLLMAADTKESRAAASAAAFAAGFGPGAGAAAAGAGLLSTSGSSGRRASGRAT